jgi:hypothetical protein
MCSSSALHPFPELCILPHGLNRIETSSSTEQLTISQIPGTTSPSRVAENYATLTLSLTGDEEAEIRKACDDAVVHGQRYPADFLVDTFSDTPPL